MTVVRTFLFLLLVGQKALRSHLLCCVVLKQFRGTDYHVLEAGSMKLSLQLDRKPRNATPF